MGLRTLGRLTALIGATFLIVGCGQGSVTESAPTVQTRTDLGHSEGAPLMYVSGSGTSYVVSYPEGEEIGSIPHGAASVCSDDAGNVFLPTVSEILEYAHGATTPKATLTIPYKVAAIDCAVDPVTGDLAVNFAGQSIGGVAVFAHASGTPTIYQGYAWNYMSYDNQGNLFVDSDGQYNVILAELPRGGTSFQTIKLPNLHSSLAGRVQWDGSYITLQTIASDRQKSIFINRLAISGSTATVVGTTNLQGKYRRIALTYIYDGRVIMPYGQNKSTGNLSVWRYSTGKRVQIIKDVAGKRKELSAVTVSVAPSK